MKENYKWINCDPYELIVIILKQDKEKRKKDKVITELLKRIAILEREVEKHEGF